MNTVFHLHYHCQYGIPQQIISWLRPARSTENSWKYIHIWLQIMKDGTDYLHTTCKFPGIPCKGQLESYASFTPGGRLWQP